MAKAKAKANTKKKATKSTFSEAKKLKLTSAVRSFIYASFPGALERRSHGARAWFVAGKQFAALADNHHGDGEFALWLAAPEGAQEMLIEAEPEHFYRPAYVGHLGWVAVRIDKAPWTTVQSVIESAWRTRAGKKQLDALAARSTKKQA